MFTNRVEHATQIDQSWTIEMEHVDGHSTDRRQAQDQRKIFIPGKMVIPAVLTRMKEGTGRTRDWLGGNDASSLVLVAALTAECQVLRCSRSPETTRQNMINGEGVCGVLFLSAAVFAALPRTLRYQATQLGRNMLVRHVRGNGSQVDP